MITMVINYNILIFRVLIHSENHKWDKLEGRTGGERVETMRERNRIIRIITTESAKCIIGC